MGSGRVLEGFWKGIRKGTDASQTFSVMKGGFIPMKKVIVMTEQEYWNRIAYLKENGPEFGVKVRVFCYKLVAACALRFSTPRKGVLRGCQSR